tara:strand:- start:62 stop:682 length:621 start_codon:yes stop_codon:yes gene_type:complete
LKDSLNEEQSTPEKSQLGGDMSSSTCGDSIEQIDGCADEGIQAIIEEKEHFKAIAQRAQADLINYRSRASQEQDEVKRSVSFRIIGRFLNVSDDLIRVVDNAPGGVDEGWMEGILLVLRNIENVLEMEGVMKIEAKGALFDPHQHEALLYEETREAAEGTVIEVIQVGYRIGDKILRPARVTVAKIPDDSSLTDDNSDLGKQQEEN